MKMIRSIALLFLASAAATTGMAFSGPAVDGRVDALVQAGEIAPAIRLAQSIEDPAARREALTAIAAAVHGGNSGDRTADEGNANSGSGTPTTAGGGGADFTPIIDLITGQTGGDTWEQDGGSGTITPFESGIRVNPQGMICRVRQQELAGLLESLAAVSRKVDVDAELATASERRMVSLTRLEKEVARRMEAGQPIPTEMKNLAGLTRIENVFVYPDTGEIVVAGPAEGWSVRGDGRMVANSSKLPTLQLDDLVTVLRTFGPGGNKSFGCSIDPRQENVQALQQLVAESASRGPIPKGQTAKWVASIDDALGQADVSVYGVPAASRVAHVMVDADYRMKLIGLDELDAGEDVPGYFGLLARNREFISGGLDALRWWMTMDYESIRQSGDRNAYAFNGSGVLCLSENQMLTADGQRVPTGKTEPVNRMFAENFTKHYEELAARETVFADLRGIMDLALVAALIEQDKLAALVGWDRSVFAAGGKYQPAEYITPQTADAVAAHRVFNGKDIVVQAAGGVQADLMSVVRDGEKRVVDAGLSAEAAAATDETAGRWWWDAR